FCPGPTQKGHGEPGLSDWLAEKIEAAAGRPTQGEMRDPLTFGDIWRGDGKGDKDHRAVDLRMMTTNLSLRRPNALPRMDGNHYFKVDEFKRLFPGWVVDSMMRTAE